MKLRIHVFIVYCLLLISAHVNIWGQKQTKIPSFEAYINKYKTLAIRQQQEYKIPASITLAQGLLESSAGNSMLARKGNNHFGIKCKPEWRGGRIFYDDDKKNECFRTYRTAEDSYTDHSIFLATRKYYTSLFQLDQYDYKGWARGLQRCGYATDKSYAEKLIRIIETYELYRFDKNRVIERPIRVDDIYNAPAPRKKNEETPIVDRRRWIYETNGIHYTMAQENDTYDIIAYDMRQNVKKLLKYNEITTDRRLHKGDIVYLQNKKKLASKDVALTHIVEAGESLYSIAQEYGIKLKMLYKLNKLSNNYRPRPGDRLKVRH